MDKPSEPTIVLPGSEAHLVEPPGAAGAPPSGPSQASEEIREAMDTSRRGAPSVGEAVSDLFSTDEIFHRLMATADEEFARSSRLLFLSGLAAGLSIGLTFLARAAMTGLVGSADGTGLVGNLLYPIGFLFIVLGRYQLYTENTLTPVTLVLTRLASLPRLLKIWGIVFAANLAGAAVAALLFSQTAVMEPEAREAAYGFGEHALALAWWPLFFKGMIAGWMVAGMVWLMHAVRDSVARVFLVYFIMFLVPSLGLFHCVIGACELFYFVLEGGVGLGEGAARFLLPVTLGNTVGGVLFVALPNYFQTREETFREWVRLSWREWFWGQRRRPGTPTDTVMTAKKPLLDLRGQPSERS
ncbi:MAG: formate/nitrite transporter family protein [Rubricoccaceae bacterium]|nr:formate/nitrite transporter family protein [Rubricoccaceae bacterium]